MEKTLKANYRLVNESYRAIPFYAKLGSILVAVFCIQALLNLEWPLLKQIQQVSLYKQITGFAFLAVILMQWQLYVLRSRQTASATRTVQNSHRYFGALLPIVLYLHSMDFGYGIQTLLLLSFLITIVSGVLSPQAIRLRGTLYLRTWLVIHVLSATLTLLFCLYHIYATYWYE